MVKGKPRKMVKWEKSKRWWKEKKIWKMVNSKEMPQNKRDSLINRSRWQRKQIPRIETNEIPQTEMQIGRMKCTGLKMEARWKMAERKKILLKYNFFCSAPSKGGVKPIHKNLTKLSLKFELLTSCIQVLCSPTPPSDQSISTTKTIQLIKIISGYKGFQTVFYNTTC